MYSSNLISFARYGLWLYNNVVKKSTTKNLINKSKKYRTGKIMLRQVNITFEELFPWVVWLADFFEGMRYPIWVFHTVAGFVLCIPFIMIILGYEPQLFPRPKLVRWRYKWTSRSVALFGMLTAALVIVYYFGGFFPIIPGVMSFFVLAWIFEWMLPVIFGWPGIWAAIAGELIGELLTGWFVPIFIVNYIAHLGFLGWLGWKTFGRDTSFKTARSWGWWVLGYGIYVFFNIFGWGAQLVLAGVLPLEKIFIYRSMVNIANYVFPNIPIQIALIIVVERLARRRRLHWQTMSPQPYSREA